MAPEAANVIMSPEIANVILQFLTRVELKGHEVPAFNKVVEVVAKLAQTPTIPEPTPKEE